MSGSQGLFHYQGHSERRAKTKVTNKIGLYKLLLQDIHNIQVNNVQHNFAFQMLYQFILQKAVKS